VGPAGIALAVGVGRSRIVAITRLLDDHAPFGCKQAAVSGISGGKYAVHHVHAQGHVFGQLLRHSNTHYIAWAVARQEWRSDPGHLQADWPRLAH